MSSRLLAWLVPLMAEAAALLRSAGLAWAVGADELGRAMVLALVLRLAEMVGDIGIDRLLAQSPNGDAPDFLAALHGAALLRGLAMAGLLLALAAPMALALPDGAGIGAFAALALVPALRGLLHLDYRRAERRFAYLPMAVVEGGSVLAMLAALPVALTLWPDHRAMVAVLVAQAAAQLALSHLVAGQPWRLAFDRTVLREVFGFGLPLVANAMLLFLIFQADRLIVAGFYGWAEVAIYGVALQLAMLPAQIAGRAAGSLLAPRFRIALAADRLDPAVRTALRAYLLLSLAFALGFALLAPATIALVYGESFRPSAALALALGLVAGLRILRTPLSQRAVTLGRTADPARANLWRAAAILPALGAALAGLPLVALALAALGGEAAAALSAFALARRPAAPALTEVPA